MRTIMLLNAKGGSGKSTLATNIASYYADKGQHVVLVDFDPQQSSMDWLKVRPADRPEIRGINATGRGYEDSWFSRGKGIFNASEWGLMFLILSNFWAQNPNAKNRCCS